MRCRRPGLQAFHAVDPGRWRGGYWHHGEHGGRFGWWWVVGDGWYFYPYVATGPEGWTLVVPQEAPPAS